MAEPNQTSSTPRSAIDAVFETILADIVRGSYPPGARLPAERELSRILGASRPTLREALRRLSDWCLVEPRRGSGIVVRPRVDWSIEVLPAYLRFATPGPGEASIPQLLRDLLSIRRTLIRELILIVADRIPPGATAKPRAAVARAWQARADLGKFTVEDFGVIRSVVEAAHFLPAVWLLNRLSGVYLDIAASLSGNLQPPATYLDAHERFLTALDVGDGPGAAKIIEAYLDEHDRNLMSALEVFS